MWSIPNIMTMARLATLPVIVVLIWPGFESRESCFWAGFIYMIAAFADIADGVVARYTGQVTVFGKFLDPLADKLFYLTTLIALLQLDPPRVPPWIVMVVLTRELAITGLRAIAASEGIVIAADTSGKIKTTFSSAGMVFLLFHYPYLIDFGVLEAVVNTHSVGLWLTYITVALTVSSGVSYVRNFLHVLDQKS